MQRGRGYRSLRGRCFEPPAPKRGWRAAVPTEARDGVNICLLWVVESLVAFGQFL